MSSIIKMYNGSRGLGVFNEITNVKYAIEHCQKNGHIWFLANQGDARQAKVNGAVKLWKREPNRLQVPIKYGQYEYAYLTEHDVVTGRLLELVQELGKDKDKVAGSPFCKRCGTKCEHGHFDRYGICLGRKHAEKFTGQIYTAETIRFNRNPNSPIEGDILTTDYRHFYKDGKLVFVTEQEDWKKALINADLSYAVERIWMVPENGVPFLLTLI